MKTILICSCLIGVLLIPFAYAEDNGPFSGGIFLGERALNLDNQSAKFNQYNGITPGPFGGGNVAYDKDRYYFTAEGSYLGDDDMFLRAKGGKWGDYKYSLYFTEFPHNISFENRTIYTSPGSQALSFPGSTASIPRNSANWPSTSFDYAVTRRDVGGSFDFTAIKPFFFNVEANRLQREGQTPWGAPSALTPASGSSFGRTTQFPLPVDDKTSNISAVAGWKNKQYYLALGGGFSEYRNSAELTQFRDPFTTGSAVATSTVVGPPNNQSWNMNFKGTAKLPLASTFAATGSYTHNTSETTLLNTIEDGTQAAPIVRTLGLNRNTFHGDADIWNFGGTLTSNPWKDLNTKLYFKYFDKKNNSDFVTFTAPGTGTAPVTNPLFDYQKTNIGGEASYRFLKNLKGILGYDFSDLQRRERDLVAPTTLGPFTPDTWEHRITAQMVYNPLDWLGARLKYQRLYTGSHFDNAFPINPTGTNSPTPNQDDVLHNNVGRFDATNKMQDMLKLTTDLTPLENLDIALEYAYKFDNYYQNVLGYRYGKQNEFVLDGSYAWKGMKFFTFFDYDVTYTDQRSRNVTPNPVTSGSTSNADALSGVVNSNSYNWGVQLDNKNYAYGLGTSLPIVKDKLSFVLQYDFEKNNGTANFTSQYLATGLNQNNIDIAPWGDYTRQVISARLYYNITKNLGLTLGYLYSQYRLNDGQLNGYQYIVPAGSASTATTTYLTGAYTDQSYKVNTGYVRATYRF
jgi:MtrB/PioB family decaheme-associated outer membrane protein